MANNIAAAAWIGKETYLNCFLYGTQYHTTSATTEKDNLGGYHKDKQLEGNGNARS